MLNMLIEGEDFYYNKAGLMVLTASYHLKKGTCCGNGCLHCPYEYINVPEPKRSQLLSSRHEKEESHARRQTSNTCKESN